MRKTNPRGYHSQQKTSANIYSLNPPNNPDRDPAIAPLIQMRKMEAQKDCHLPNLHSE